jgi:hypothetical protein
VAVLREKLILRLALIIGLILKISDGDRITALDLLLSEVMNMLSPQLKAVMLCLCVESIVFVIELIPDDPQIVLLGDIVFMILTLWYL